MAQLKTHPNLTSGVIEVKFMLMCYKIKIEVDVVGFTKNEEYKN